MSRELASDEKKAVKRPKPHENVVDKQRPIGPNPADVSGVLNLQKTVGNQAVQRLITQRSGEGAFELDDTTANRINQARGGGQSLDQTVQTQMGQAMGHDFSDVRVHTSSEADGLNQQLGAKAFTTGQDVFFKQGAYDPGSSSGQELIAHELTHVVQQNSGQVGGSGSGMTVRPAGDAFEQEADAMAKQVVNSGPTPAVQTAADGGVQRMAPEEEEAVTMKRDDAVQRAAEEEEMVEMKRDDAIQRAGEPEEEEMIEMKRDDAVQRQEELPEEEL